MKTILALSALLLLLACNKEGNPVALPTSPGDGSALTLTVKADASQLTAGTTKPATLTITAVRADGSAAADGTPVNLNTNLGAFSFDASGKPVQTASLTLLGGRATAQFFAGAAAGTANIMAAAGTSLGALHLPIVAAPPQPVANFTFTASGLTVLFTDASAGSPAEYAWDFGDMETSTERNPSHTYRAAGTYTVVLTVRNAGGESSKSQFVPVSLGAPPKAAFEFTVTGQQVNFVDMSTDATSWRWDFGDNTTSNARSPVHVYLVAATFTVTLTASNAAGSATASKAVPVAPPKPPKAAFAFTVTGQQVNFVDASVDAASWQWNFGDDSAVSTARDPIHTYLKSGAFTVTLTVWNSAGSDTAAQVVPIAPGQPPKSAFTFRANDRFVTFADASTGNPASWNWTFGDGASSTEQNPTHLYPAYGNFTVVLQVRNGAGPDSSSQIVTLTAPPPPAPPVASFTATPSPNPGDFRVNFVDTSTGNPTSRFWTFGDGGTSTLQNPQHEYASSGTYTVTLTVANANGSSMATKAVATAPAN